MKIQSINYINCSRPSFYKKKNRVDYYDDYTTEYNQITIKDAFISASILSIMLMLGGVIVNNGSKIRDFFINLKQRKLF